jgi:hypothetical protein
VDFIPTFAAFVYSAIRGLASHTPMDTDRVMCSDSTQQLHLVLAGAVSYYTKQEMKKSSGRLARPHGPNHSMGLHIRQFLDNWAVVWPSERPDTTCRKSCSLSFGALAVGTSESDDRYVRVYGERAKATPSHRA